MVKLFVVLGLALLAGGAYAIVDGWPYLVLERGFTEVILGALAAIAGLILLALAAVLAEVRRLKGLVSGAMAAIALSEPRADEPRLAPAEAPLRAEPVLDKASTPAAGHIGIATTLAAGAGAAAAVGALTGLAKAEEPAGETASDKTEEADKTDDAVSDDERSSHAGTVAAEPQQPPAPVPGDIDDWLLPTVAPALDVAPSEVKAEERNESDEAEGKLETVEDEQGPSALSDIDEPTPSELEDKESEDAKPLTVQLDELEAVQAKDQSDAAEQETAEQEGTGHDATSASDEDRVWWPRIDHPSTEAAASIDDEFTALRDQLSGVVNAPEVETPRRDRDVLGSAESWTAPRAWPPVTQPRDPGALSDAEAEVADKPPLEDTEAEAAAGSEPAVVESGQQEEPARVADSATPEVPAAEAVDTGAEARPDKEPVDEEPAASEEGVIGAYQVGEAQFTMFADGSIHARTPDGDYTFASMDELKAYLASEKDKLETGAGSDRTGSV